MKKKLQDLTIKNLSHRSRYYHSQMDMDILLKGEDYSSLPDTYVIFICDYDPVGRSLYRYSFCSKCMETREVLNDGTHTIWLSTKGENDIDVPAVLTDFLKYVGDPEHAESEESEFVKEVERRVNAVKQSRRCSDRYSVQNQRTDGCRYAYAVVIKSVYIKVNYRVRRND